ncbi:MAG: hypothetical protein R3B54_17575 [Bdellovibrionota bacterium]
MRPFGIIFLLLLVLSSVGYADGETGEPKPPATSPETPSSTEDPGKKLLASLKDSLEGLQPGSLDGTISEIPGDEIKAFLGENPSDEKKNELRELAKQLPPEKAAYITAYLGTLTEHSGEQVDQFRKTITGDTFKSGGKELTGADLRSAVGKKFAEIDAAKELSPEAKLRLKSEVLGKLSQDQKYQIRYADLPHSSPQEASEMAAVAASQGICLTCNAHNLHAGKQDPGTVSFDSSGKPTTSPTAPKGTKSAGKSTNGGKTCADGA